MQLIIHWLCSAKPWRGVVGVGGSLPSLSFTSLHAPCPLPMKAGDNGILMEMMNGFPFRLLLSLTDCILKDSPASSGRTERAVRFYGRRSSATSFRMIGSERCCSRWRRGERELRPRPS